MALPHEPGEQSSARVAVLRPTDGGGVERTGDLVGLGDGLTGPVGRHLASVARSIECGTVFCSRVMCLTSKGQVTIPIEIRERLGLVPGTIVDFEVDGAAVRMTMAKNGQDRGTSLVQAMRGRGDVDLSTDEIMALTRGE